MHLGSSIKIAVILVALSPVAFAFTDCGHSNRVAGSSDESSSGGGGGDSTLYPCGSTDASLKSPTTIDELMQLINALPKPLSLDCLIKNLATPLQVVAVNNTNSAQPSAGPQSPRIFLIRTPLLMSVVPEGSTKYLLEVSQVEPSSTSVKGEIEFPVMASLPPSTPYDRVLGTSGGTSCRSCHLNEYKVLRGYNGTAYASNMIRPDNSLVVPVSQLNQYALNCNSSADAYRCAILKAIFIDGQGQTGVFP